MKKYILTAFLVLYFVGHVYAGMIIQQFSSGAGATDYTSDANCMGAWYLNSSGDETDRSGEGNTLTEQTAGDIPTSVTVPSGFSGTSRDFENGDNEGLLDEDGSTLDISGNQDMSIVAWIKLESTTTGGIVVKYTSVGSQRQYQMAYRSDNDALCGYISSNGTAYSKAIGGTNTVDDTNWHHVAMVFDYDVGGSTITLYVDGSEDTNGTDNPKSHTGGINDSTADVCIGCSASSTMSVISTSTFDGLIDEVAIFNRKLSAAEVNEIYTDGIDGDNGGND